MSQTPSPRTPPAPDLMAEVREILLEWPAARVQDQLERLRGQPLNPEEAIELEALGLLVRPRDEPADALALMRRAHELQQLAETLQAGLAEAAAWRALHALQVSLHMLPAALHSAGMAARAYARVGTPGLAQQMRVLHVSLLFQAEMYEELASTCAELARDATQLPVVFRYRVLSGAGAAAFCLALRSADDARMEAQLQAAVAWQQQGLALAQAHGLDAQEAASHVNLAVLEAVRGDAERSAAWMAALDVERFERNGRADAWDWLQFARALREAPHTPGGWQALMAVTHAVLAKGQAVAALREACLYTVKRLGSRHGRLADALWASEQLIEARLGSVRQLTQTLCQTMEAALERPQLLEERDSLVRRGYDLEGSLAARNAELSDTLARLQAEVSVRQATEAALQQAHDELEARVQERGEQLEQALRTLMQQEKQLALTRMVAGLAHEMNTPLGNARLGASTLAEQTAALQGRLGEGSLRRSDLQQLLQQLQAAGGLVDDSLLRVTQLVQRFKALGQGEETAGADCIDLVEVVQLSARSWQAQLAQAGVHLALALPPTLPYWGDAMALQQVLQQLLENSLRHGFAGRTGGTITLALTAQAQGPRLRWHDDGVGIAPERLPRVFEPFQTTQLGRSGVGLGLTSVYALVTEHLKGRIEVDSPPGAGTGFTLQLPPAYSGAPVTLQRS